MVSVLYDYTPTELQNLLDTSNGYCDLLRKIGLNGHGANPDTLKKIIKEYNLDTTQNSINRSNLYRKNAKETHLKIKYKLQDILDGKYPNYQSGKLLKRLVDENMKEYKCEICGITEWNKKHISLVLHHKDGNHSNNDINNLQVLCPNCHSQTDTYAGKSSRKNKQEINKKKDDVKTKTKTKEIKLPPVSREDLKLKIRKYPFTYIAKEYSVTDNAIKKWCIKYQLPSKKSEIKKYSDKEWNNI